MKFEEIHLGEDIRTMINHLNHAYIYEETVHVAVGDTCEASIFLDPNLGYETICINLVSNGLDNIEETHRLSELISSMVLGIKEDSALAYLSDIKLEITMDVIDEEH